MPAGDANLTLKRLRGRAVFRGQRSDDRGQAARPL